MPNDKKLDKLKQLMALISNDTVTPAEITKFLTMVIEVIKRTNENFQQLSTENLQKIEDSLTLIKEQHNKVLGQIDGKSSELEGTFNVKIGLVGRLLKEVGDIKATPGKDGVAGKNPDPEDVVPLVLKKIKLPETVLDSGEKIVEKLESLKGEERLDASAIKGLPKTKDGKNWYVGSQTKQVQIYDLSSQLNGALKTFSLPAFWLVFDVRSSSFPYAFRPTVDYTTDASAFTITFTSEIDVNSCLQTGQTLYVLYVSS